ncbi:CPBP family intramembrane glutamic endopeptidase [Micromonospora sp. NPDC004704]
MHTGDVGGDRRIGLGWRVLIVLVAGVVIWRSVYGVAEWIFGSGYDRAGHVFRAVAITALVVPMVVLARRFLDRRPWAGLRLAPPSQGWRPLLVGAAAYLVPLPIGLAVVLGLGWATLSVHASVGEVVLSAAGLLLLVLLYEALPEELIFRGYLYRNLVTAVPAWLAVCAQAVLFSLFGLALGADAGRAVIFLGFGFVLGLIRMVTGSLWAPIGFHLLFQTCAQLAGPDWDLVTVTNRETLEIAALGTIPIGLGAVAIRLLHRHPAVDQTAREPDPAPIG